MGMAESALPLLEKAKIAPQDIKVHPQVVPAVEKHHMEVGAHGNIMLHHAIALLSKEELEINLNALAVQVVDALLGRNGGQMKKQEMFMMKIIVKKNTSCAINVTAMEE